MRTASLGFPGVKKRRKNEFYIQKIIKSSKFYFGDGGFVIRHGDMDDGDDDDTDDDDTDDDTDDDHDDDTDDDNDDEAI